MLVNMGENKWQIIISSFIGFLYFYYSKDITYSMILVLILSIILRKINIDKNIDNIINKRV